MRDIGLAVFLFGSIPFILRKPHIGVLLFVWVSVMNPHRLTWSFSYDFGYAQMIAIVTLLGAVLSRELRRPPMTALVVALLLFVAWTCVTTLFAIHPADSYPRWVSM